MFAKSVLEEPLFKIVSISHYRINIYVDKDKILYVFPLNSHQTSSLK